MTVRSYSTTPAANNAAPPNGAPEGMLPSAVNNTLRQVMADVRDTFEQLPYFDYGHTPTRIDNDTFTVPTDLTALYAAGIRLKLVGASTGYATVASSSYSAPDTTVNVTMDSGNVPTALSAVSLTSVDILLRSDLANTTTAGKGNELVSIRRTDAEIAGGVAPVNLFYWPGDVRRYGDITSLSSWTAAKTQYLAGGPPILQLPMRITHFGGKPNNASFDNTAAFNTAVSFCASLGYQEIFFPGANNTWYFNTKPNAMPVGIMLRGENPRSFLVRNYNASTTFESFLEWNGSQSGGGDAVKGGGIDHIGLLAGTSTTQGVAINILGTDTTNRPGYMSFRDFVISGNGSWSFGIRADGTNITTSGSQGQRDCTFSGGYIFRCSGEHIQVSNGVHFFFNSITLVDGGLGVTPTFRITGAGASTSNSDEIHCTNLDCEGNLIIQNCTNVVVTGRVVGTLTIDSTATNVAFVGTANTVTNTCTTAAVVDSANGISISSSTGLKLLNNSVASFTAIHTTATAGGGTLPATPTAFIDVIVNNSPKRIPYYEP